MNRLTMLGPEKELVRIVSKSNWMARAGAAHPELLEWSESRRAWEFATPEPPLEFLKRLSSRWTGLTFLLEYEEVDRRLMGLAKIKENQVEHSQVRY
jgi:hypothetical protein